MVEFLMKVMFIFSYIEGTFSKEAVLKHLKYRPHNNNVHCGFQLFSLSPLLILGTSSPAGHFSTAGIWREEG